LKSYHKSQRKSSGRAGAGIVSPDLKTCIIPGSRIPNHKNKEFEMEDKMMKKFFHARYMPEITIPTGGFADEAGFLAAVRTLVKQERCRRLIVRAPGGRQRLSFSLLNAPDPKDAAAITARLKVAKDRYQADLANAEFTIPLAKDSEFEATKLKILPRYIIQEARHADVHGHDGFQGVEQFIFLSCQCRRPEPMIAGANIALCHPGVVHPVVVGNHQGWALLPNFGISTGSIGSGADMINALSSSLFHADPKALVDGAKAALGDMQKLEDEAPASAKAAMDGKATAKVKAKAKDAEAAVASPRQFATFRSANDYTVVVAPLLPLFQ